MTRALIRVERDRGACNVLWAKTITVPAEQDPSDLDARYSNYRDLEHEWDFRRPDRAFIEAKRPYWELVKDQPCPRCKGRGAVYVEIYREQPHGGSWHVPCWIPA